MSRLLLVIASLLLFTGCGDKLSLNGKVQFADGKPLTVGIVCFQGTGITARAPIQADGTFRVSTVKKDDGISPGSYKVFIAGAYIGDSSVKGDPKSDGGIPEGNITPLIDEKLMNPDTSGIICEVKSGMKLPFIIEVKEPAK
ncbi:MAG: hypothetical protein FWE67_06360 [Planctomycetaceae bacterium]|nr:hypothetical protein [Planctomycetaceae bacterium]